MPENASATEQIKATGTWNITAPVNHFTTATYRIAGKVVSMPVEVAGEHITGQLPGTGHSQS
jgi:hypothetical protein